jgi:3-methylcrotonyl-CoA carboxylase alpha subunit
MTFSKVLIANRGEIACRIMRTCRDMGLQTVAVFSDADRDAAHVRLADEAVHIGGAASAESYLVADRIIAAALRTGAGAIHPGYGFLSENAGFAAAVEAAGLVFVGPGPAAITAMGSKIAAKQLMREHGVPVVPGYDATDATGQSDEAFIAAASTIGFPLLVKASAGGGGKGMRIVLKIEELPSALASARREATASFGDPSLLIERYIQSPRHLEVQIFGDAHGHVVHLFERECSIQRRHQKILEEAPSPTVDAALRHQLGTAAVKAGEAIGYRSAGTVEFVFDDTTRDFFFLEVNTRLQVEHPVTECVTGLDLVRLQLEVALGRPLPFTQADLDNRGPVGHAIEARLYAEDPNNDFLPQTGRLADFHWANRPGLRLDTGVATGDEVSIHYDPMLAKVIAFGFDRAEANRRLLAALNDASVAGCTTNLAFLRRVLAHPAWQAAQLSTHFIADHKPDLLAAPDSRISKLGALFATVAQALADQATSPILPLLAPRWRNNPHRPPPMSWVIAGETIVQAYRPIAPTHTDHTPRFEVGLPDSIGHTVAVVAAPDLTSPVQSLRLLVDDHLIAARLVVRGDTTFVHFDGHDLVLTRVPRFPAADTADTAGARKAPMPGKVLAVKVAAGDVVEAGQVLVVLEAMKMEHNIESPIAGLVGEVLVQAGEVVAADQELVTVLAS